MNASYDDLAACVIIAYISSQRGRKDQRQDIDMMARQKEIGNSPERRCYFGNLSASPSTISEIDHLVD